LQPAASAQAAAGIKYFNGTRNRLIEIARPRERSNFNRENHMARIAGVDIPRNKKIEVSITYIFGIGTSNGMVILQKANVNPSTRVRDLTEEEVGRIREVVDREYRVEGDLRREVQLNIKRLMDIACYRGLRHRKGMPVRGQRTRTNARTRRGRKGQAIGIKKKTAKK
jgi:small subunit ribosomal protein S13